MKICSKKDCIFAGISQPLISFDKRNNRKNGLQSACKSCCKKQNKQWHQENKESTSIYYKKRYQKNRQQKLASQKIYAQNHKEEIKQYRQNHKKEAALNKRLRRETDIQFRLAENLRSRLNGAIKGSYRSGSAVEDLMMSIADFKVYLGQKFYSNPDTGEIMSWDNYGFYGWHIDHIIPLCAFDLTNREELLKACHFSNLRPMWAERNWSENDRGLSRNRISVKILET